jgi:hypothetical protein
VKDRIMFRITLAFATALAALPAAANPPAFAAECDKGVIVHADGTGRVSIDGKPAEVAAEGADSWTARAGSMTLTITATPPAPPRIATGGQNDCRLTAW